MGFFKLQTELLLNNCWNKLNRIRDVRDPVSIYRRATWRWVFVAMRTIDIRSRVSAQMNMKLLRHLKCDFFKLRILYDVSRRFAVPASTLSTSPFFSCFAVKCAIKEQKISRNRPTCSSSCLWHTETFVTLPRKFCAGHISRDRRKRNGKCSLRILLAYAWFTHFVNCIRDEHLVP